MNSPHRTALLALALGFVVALLPAALSASNGQYAFAYSTYIETHLDVVVLFFFQERAFGLSAWK